MSLPHTVSEILRDHVTLEVESIDRMYLNLYVPQLQHETGVVGFFRYHRGQPMTSSALMAPMTRAFVAAIETFVQTQAIPVVTFLKDQRKDDVAADYLAHFPDDEGILFVARLKKKLRSSAPRNATIQRRAGPIHG